LRAVSASKCIHSRGSSPLGELTALPRPLAEFGEVEKLGEREGNSGERDETGRERGWKVGRGGTGGRRREEGHHQVKIMATALLNAALKTSTVVLIVSHNNYWLFMDYFKSLHFLVILCYLFANFLFGFVR